MHEQLEEERRHVAISLGQMNKCCSACVRVRVETRDRKLVFLKYSFTAVELSQHSDQARRTGRGGTY